MYIDSHAHLSYLSKKGIDPAVFFSEWEATDGGYILDPGVESGDLVSRMETGAGKSYVVYAAGIWPGGDAAVHPGPHLEAFRHDAARPEVIAIGECGLDYHWNEGGAGNQRQLFEAQLETAQSLRKPVIVHSRDADADTISILSNFRGLTGIIHCCPFTAKDALILVDRGFYVSFAGNITYKNAESLRETARAIPLERLLVETDAPYLSPEGKRGKPNTPLNIPAILRYLSDIREMDEKKLKTIVDSNFKALFSLP